MTAPTRPDRHLSWPLVALLDLLLIGAAGIAGFVLLSGGGRSELAGITVSARTWVRPVAAVVILLLIRLKFARSAPLLGLPRGSYQRLVARLPTDMPAAAHGVPGARSFLRAVLGFCLVGAALLHPQLRQMDAVPDFGDPLFSMWRIGWVQLQLHGDPRPLFDANIFHPEPLTLTFSDSMLLTSLAATPLLAAGVPLAVTYNVLMAGSFLLSAMAMWLLVARLTGSAHAAFLAGVLYGFHPYRFEHYSHLELQMTYWMPLGLLAMHRFLETPRLRYVLLAALCLVGQLYSSMYYAVFFPIYALAVFVPQLIVRRAPLRPLIGPALLAGLLAGAAAVPLARPYVAAESARGERPLDAVDSYSATATDYFRAHQRSALYGDTLLPGRLPERALFPGFVVLVLAAIALVPPLGAARLAYLIGLLVAFDMSTGLNGVLYPHLYDWLSPIRGMRVPARFSIILGISLVVLAAYGARRLLDRLRSERSRPLAFGLIVVAAVFELRPVLALKPVWPTPPPIYAAVDGRDDVVLAELPFSIDGTSDALPQMYFSTWHGREMVNGYSGFMPASYAPLLDVIWLLPGPEALSTFRARGVTHVTVTCALLAEPAQCDEFLQRFDSSPDFRQIVATRWQGHPSRLYELLPPETPSGP